MTDPIDETQPHPTVDPAAVPRSDAATPPAGMPSGPTSAPSTPTDERLRVDPERRSDNAWREPAWFPPRERDRRDRGPSAVAVVVGLFLIALGVWFFLDRTLGFAMPRIQWSSVWPVILIVIGGLIIVRSFQRRA